MADDLKRKLSSGEVVALATTITEGKASLVVGVTDDLTPGVSAVDWCGSAPRPTLGSKGRRQASRYRRKLAAPDVGKIDAALEGNCGALN